MHRGVSVSPRPASDTAHTTTGDHEQWPQQASVSTNEVGPLSDFGATYALLELRSLEAALGKVGPLHSEYLQSC